MNPVREALAQLEAALPDLPERDQRFARSLLDQAAGRGISDKQLFWVRKLAGLLPEAPKQVVGDIAPIVAMFDAIQAKRATRPGVVARLPKITFEDVVLHIATEASRAPGSVVVKNKARDYLGQIGKDGIFRPAPALTPEQIVATGTVLREFAAAPLEYAAQHGKNTGACCFCNKLLTDEISVGLGYGPVCAVNWGLAHNQKALRAERVAA